MRPDPEEILRGLGRVVDQVLSPELSSAYGRAQAMSVLLLIEHVASRIGKVEHYREVEREDLLSTAAAAEQELAQGDESRWSKLIARLHAAREMAAACGEGGLGELRCALSEVIRRTLFDPAAPAGLRHVLGAYLKRCVARDREWVRVGEVTW